MSISIRVLAIATVMCWLTNGSADVLYKKRAAISIGFGSRAKSMINWAPCDRSKTAKYPKPPFWFSKGDTCQLRADRLGLGTSDHGYVALNIKKVGKLFPDAKRGDSITYTNDVQNGLIRMTFGTRSLLLPYSAPATEQQQISDELSVAAGYVNVGKEEIARDLLEDTNRAIKTASPASFAADFIKDTGDQLFQIKDRAPALSSISRSSLLRLAYLRTTLEKRPDISTLGQNPGCEMSEAQDLTVSTVHLNFGSGNPCGIALVQKPYGQTLRAAFSQSVIEGGTHVLDGITWVHDTFIGSHIRYRGGPVSLQYVLFINCTFEVPDNPRGDRLVNLAISESPQLTIGDESSIRRAPIF